MSDFGLFESDEAERSKPQVQARLAAHMMEAAIDTVRSKFGKFLMGATGIDEFGDRWHLSKHDIRAAVEPHVFPNTGTMRRIQNAMKADWKLAHPYKLAADYTDHPGVPLDQLPLPGMSPHGDPDPVAVAFDENDEPIDHAWNSDTARSLAQEGYNVQAVGDDVWHNQSGEHRVPQQKIQDIADYEKRLRNDLYASRHYAEDRDAPFQDIDETYHPSSGNLIPKGDFESWKDSVDQGGPEKVESHAFTPGGDSGSDKHARRRQAGDHFMRDRIDQAYENGGRLDEPLVGVNPGDGVYRNHPGMLDGYGYDSGQYGEYGYDAKSDPDFVPADYLGPAGRDMGGKHRAEAARLVADIYTDFARSNGLRVASLDTLDRYASTGIHEADYRLLASMIVRTAESEDCECDDEDEDADSEAPSASESDDSDSDEGSDDDYDFGGEDDAEDDESDEDGDGDHDDDDHHTEDDDEDYDFGGDEGGAESGGGQQFTVPEHAPELPPEMMAEIPQDDQSGSAPVPPEVIDSLLGLPEGTIEQLLLEEVEQGGDSGMGGAPQGGGDDFFGEGGGDNTEPPRVARRRQSARSFWAGSRRTALEEGETPAGGSLEGPMEMNRGVPERWWPESEDDLDMPMVDKITQQYHDDPFRKHGPELDPAAGHAGFGEFGTEGWDFDAVNAVTDARQKHERGRTSARSFWAAEGDPEQESDSGSGEQAAPAQDPAAAMGGGDPAAMGGQPMMPPPGSQAVTPPQPPASLENQPAEDALLDTANQAIMQMIDQETAEYQQIIDPLSKALQAIQFAQQVEQAEHPMDVTPPQGTVDVSPAAAPGGAGNPMQQQARRRQAIFQTWPSDDAYRRNIEDSRDAERARNAPPVAPPRFSDEDVEYLKGLGQNPDQAGGGFSDWDSYHKYHDASRRRQAKVEFGIRNAAKLIASRYRLSATGHQMLLNAALGRRGYEHVVEALKLVPAEVRKAAALHMSHLFAAGNQRFNRDVFMKTVMASNPRDRAGDAWRDGRDRGIAEHGRQDAEDYGDEGPLVASSEPWQGFGDQGHPTASDVPWSERHRIRGGSASRGRLPFDRPRLAGETWMNTPTKDAFEFPNAGETPRVDDGIEENNLPDMPGADPHSKNAASQKAVDRFQRWQKNQQQRGLPITEGEAAVHDFLQTSRPHKKRVGPDAANMIHREMGLEPDAVKTPKAKPVKAVNPTLGKGGGQTPKAPKAKAPAPKAAPKTASFFTRKVPGWRWDDHLSGYLAKEARAFTCSCGQKIAAPSYKTCSCGKIWNVYAIGDTHHLASDTAEVFIAREIPVRPGVVMANRKMAGDPEFRGPAADLREGDHVRHLSPSYHGKGVVHAVHPDRGVGVTWEVDLGEPAQSWEHPGDLRKIGAAAQRSHRELLAEIERLADWTKYDSPDPTRDPKVKPPSTTIKSQPGDWTNRDFTGPTKGQWREPEPTELPRKTRKKK